MNAPERIYATVNGSSTRLPDGGRQLIGGWSEDKDRPRAVEYIRVDVASRQSPAGVEVKPVDWRNGCASTPIGDYLVVEEDWDDDPFWFIMFNGKPLSKLGEHKNEASAVAAAQADYERRILSCLSVESAGVKPVAWRIGHQFDGDRTVWTYFDGADEVDTDKAQPLYASPPKAVTSHD